MTPWNLSFRFRVALPVVEGGGLIPLVTEGVEETGAAQPGARGFAEQMEFTGDGVGVLVGLVEVVFLHVPNVPKKPPAQLNPGQQDVEPKPIDEPQLCPSKRHEPVAGGVIVGASGESLVLQGANSHEGGILGTDEPSGHCLTSVAQDVPPGVVGVMVGVT